MTVTSATILLLLVMDPFGGIPLFLAVLKNVDERRRTSIVVRECLIAFFVLLVFLLLGRRMMQLLQLSQTSLGIAGGIILFLIALRIIFPTRHGVFGELPEGEPLIVPLAIPLIAGPSAIATTLLLVSRWPERLPQWCLALTLSCFVTTFTLSVGSRIARILGERGISALERLLGLVLTAVAVEMFLAGVKEFIHHL